MQGRWLLVIFSISLHAAPPIRDEALRRQILAAVFPDMQVSVASSLHPANKRKQGELIFFPDALAGERVYRIIGPASEREACASEDMQTESFQTSRELSFVAYRWPQRDDLFAVLQYKFVGANPAGVCTSIGRILHLSIGGGQWTVVEDLELERTHHNGLQRIEVADVSGDGLEELLLESDWGGGGTTASSLHIYSLENGRFGQWLETTARVKAFDGAYTQVLDIPRTRARNAMSFCFRKTEYADADHELLRKPRVSLPCYPRGWNDFK